MANTDYATRSSQAGPGPYGQIDRPALPAASTDGVLGRRVVAYVIDFVVIWLLIGLLAPLIGIAGFLTFGAAWGLYLILVPGTAILYSALSIGGPSMGTIGMRLTGLRALDATNGGRVSPLLAGLHALLFYIGIGTLALYVLDIVIGLARSDRRLGHDLLADIIVVRR